MSIILPEPLFANAANQVLDIFFAVSFSAIFDDVLVFDDFIMYSFKVQI